MSLTDAILQNNVPLVKKMMMQKPALSDIDPYGFTPLIESAIVDNAEIANVLIKHGADVNQTDVTGGTALHWATENNNVPLTRLLLQAGADANAYTNSCQPVLLKPLLRKHRQLKNLLYAYGANLTFAQDYLNTKLLGHRFELSGRVDIVDPMGKFIELDWEGFILEFTVSLMARSLEHYQDNFAARESRNEAEKIRAIQSAFSHAEKLIQLQQYQTPKAKRDAAIDALMNNHLWLLPVGYEGHAISFVIYGDYCVHCDRGRSEGKHYSVGLYRITRPTLLTAEFLYYLLYQKHHGKFFDTEIKKILGLTYIDHLPIESQLAGNCSWANLEAAIPSMLLLLDLDALAMSSTGSSTESSTGATKIPASVVLADLKETALLFYEHWLRWDKDRALDQMIGQFSSASPARKASIASALAAVLFQVLSYQDASDAERVTKIISILRQPAYEYVLDSYMKIYAADGKRSSYLGDNLRHMLDVYQPG